jgi:hypothetical protein
MLRTRSAALYEAAVPPVDGSLPLARLARGDDADEHADHQGEANVSAQYQRGHDRQYNAETARAAGGMRGTASSMATPRLRASGIHPSGGVQAPASGQPRPRRKAARPERETLRLHKAIEDTGIKLGCVATDIMGKSGRAMLDALVAGTKDPEVLADLARGQLRKKLPALREALDGRPPPDEISLQSSRRPHREVLDTIGALIERAETRA